VADTSVLDDIIANVDISAVDGALGADTPPESESLPVESESAPVTEDAPSELTESAVAEPPVETEPVAAAPEPVVPVWDSPDNPYFRQLTEMRTKAQQLVEMQAAQRAQELANERIRALADEDPQRVAEINQFVQEVTAPVYQQLSRAESELDTAAKLAVVYDQAVEHFIPDHLKTQVRSEVERLMRMQAGPQAITQDIAARKADRDAFASQVAERDKEIATLRAQLAAKAEIGERAATGADAVDSVGGTPSGREARFAAATNLDEFISAVMS